VIDRSGSVRLCRLVLAALFLTACTSGFPPALPGSQLTPAATDVPVPASPVPGGSPSGAITSPPLPQQEQTVTLTFAANEYTLPAYQALAGTFHATHPAIRVVVVDLSHVHGNWRGFAPSPATLNELASNVDTFLLPESILSVGLESRALLDLTPLAESDPALDAGDFFPGILDHFRRQGRLWGLPAGVGANLVFYNKGLFDRAGVPYPAPGWTLQEFLDSAATLTAREGSDRQYGFVEAWGRQGVISFIQARGADLLDRDAVYPTPTLDDPLVAEVVQWYVDLALEHGVSPAPDELRGTIPHDLVVDNRAAMWTDILSNWAAMSARLRSGVGIAPFPEDPAAVNPVSLSGYFVSAGTGHPQACWEWLSFLTRQHVVHESSETLPTRRSVLDASAYFARMDEADRAAIRYALEHPAPPLTAYDVAVMRPLFEALDAVYAGRATVEQALANAQAEAEEEIANVVASATTAPAAPPVRPVPSPEGYSGSPSPQGGAVAPTLFVPDDLDLAPYQAWAEEFNRTHPEIRVTVSGGTPASFGDVSGASDCFVWPTFSRPADWQQHAISLQPFVDAASLDLLDEFYPQSLSGARVGDELWALPLHVAPEILYFNRDLFDAAGLPYPTDAWTWDDLATAAARLTVGESEGRQYGFAPSASGAPDALILLAQRGASPAGDVTGIPAPAFHTQAAVEALSWYAGLAPSMPPLWTEADPYAAAAERAALIRAGRVAMWTGTSWGGGPEGDLHIGAVPLPAGQRAATEFDTWAAYISAYSPNPDACWQWLAYLSDHLSEGPGVPARRSVAEGMPIESTDVERIASLASMDYEPVHLDRWRDRSAWTGWVYPWFQQAVRDVLAGERSASEALELVQGQAAEFLACLEGGEERFDEGEARACVVRIDPAYP
jgi:ABC-type glycerol-3-phosphate transport system substrate-binding protein